MSSTRVTVCVGGGGVGKTTTSAALAVALARQGKRTLVITVDPARRLADALGTEVGRFAQPVLIDPRTERRLYARMPDTRMSLDDFVVWLFDDEKVRQHVTANPAYRELGDALAGAHEISTIGLLQTEIDSGNYDEIILDTAPSRHALAFLSYPARLHALLEARALTWLSALAANAHPEEAATKPKRGLFEWGRSKAEALMGRLVGLEGLRNLSALFADMLTVREKWADLAGRTNAMLHDPATRYFIIAAPTGGALADTQYLLEQLKKRHVRPAAFVLNRAETEPPPEERRLLTAIENDSLDVPVPDKFVDALKQTLELLESEHLARGEAASTAISKLRRVAPRQTPVLRLPYVHRADPKHIVLALADAWQRLED